MIKSVLFTTLGFIAVILLLIVDANQAQALDENNCLECHRNPKLFTTNGEGRQISLYIDEAEVNTAAHRFIDCTTCHTAEPHSVATPLTKLSLAEKCGSCHQYQYKVHLESVHGQQLVQGNPDVATCIDCHSTVGNPHSVIRVLEYSAPAINRNSRVVRMPCVLA